MATVSPVGVETATINEWERNDFLRRRGSVAYTSVAIIVSTLDVILIVAASIACGTIYNSLLIQTNADFVHYAVTAIIVGAMFVLRFRSRNLYDPCALVEWNLQSRNIIVSWTLAFSLFSGTMFALKVGVDFSRGAVLSFGVVGLLVLLGHHALWGAIIESTLKKGGLRGRKSMLVCAHREGKKVEFHRGVAQNLSRHGFDVQFLVQHGPTQTQAGVAKRVVEIVRGSDIEEIFLAADMRRWEETSHLIERLSVLPIPLTVLPDEFTTSFLQRRQRRLGVTIGVEYQRLPLNASERILKRIVDVVCALSGMIVLLPMFVVVALAIKLDSPGPILFVQRRHGFNCKQFGILKFRTMNVMEDGEAIKQAVRDDDRVTRVGKWLRKTSIDELPQLLNVLVGDMSIVGPRPHATAHDSHYSDLISDYAYRHHLKPGITGWAQVHGYRGETPTVEAMKSRIKFDIWYIKNWSFLLDIQIILRTTFEVFRAHNAY